MRGHKAKLDQADSPTSIRLVSLLTAVLLCVVYGSPFMVRTEAQITPGIKTDRAVYPEPPLPTLPSKGGKFTDPVFGTQIMRATDETDYPAPGCGTFYSHWPTFNADNTRILIRCGDSGDIKIKVFDPVNFILGATLRTSPTLPGVVALDWQGATWSRTDPDLIFVHVSYYDESYPATGMKLYTYRPSTDTFNLIKDFAPALAPGQPDYLYEMHVDAHDEIFTFMHRRVGLSEPIYYIVWERSTNTVLQHIPNTLASFGPKEIANASMPDKSGRWIFFPYNLDAGAPQIGDPRIKVLDLQTNTWQTIYWTGADDTPSHGDVGTGFMIGHGNFSGAANTRSLTDVHSRSLLFDYKNANGVTDWSNDQHMTLYADDESWAMMGLYDDPDLDSYPTLETGAFEDEIMQYSLTDPSKFRRLLHHRSEIKNTTATNGYWATPKPTISHDGRFIAFTSNWEDSGRYDLFIAKIETPSTPARVNVALPANGGSASASTFLTYNGNPFPTSRAIDSDRRGLNYSAGGVWQSSTASFPQWLQVDFQGSKTIDEIDLFTLQDNYANPSEPNETMEFTWYGLTAFDVQYWNGSSWVNVPGGSVTGNKKVWKKLTFSAITTTKIRVLTSASPDSHSRVAEIEVWGTAAPPRTNFALAANGGVASASTFLTYNGNPFLASRAIDGDRRGLNYLTGGAWQSSTASFPQWLQVDFQASKTIEEIDLLMLQDNYANPIEPTADMLFTWYGLTGFEVQYWNGSSWVNIPGGSVTGNQNVWRKFNFSAITTTKIRVLTNASPDGWSRVAEIEAWQVPSSS